MKEKIRYLPDWEMKKRTQKSTPKTVYIDLICVHRGLCVWMRKALQ